MSSPFSLNLLRNLFKSRNRVCDSRQIAEKAAQLCLETVINRLNRDGKFNSWESWSSAQLRGYLRATATPGIDLALEKLLPRSRRTTGFAAQVRILEFDTLEQLVARKRDMQPMTLSAKSAAA